MRRTNLPFDFATMATICPYRDNCATWNALFKAAIDSMREDGSLNLLDVGENDNLMGCWYKFSGHSEKSREDAWFWQLGAWNSLFKKVIDSMREDRQTYWMSGEDGKPLTFWMSRESSQASSIGGKIDKLIGREPSQDLSIAWGKVDKLIGCPELGQKTWRHKAWYVSERPVASWPSHCDRCIVIIASSTELGRR